MTAAARDAAHDGSIDCRLGLFDHHQGVSLEWCRCVLMRARAWLVLRGFKKQPCDSLICPPVARSLGRVGIRIAQGAIINSGGALELINCQLTGNTATSVSDCCALARRYFVFLVSVNCAHRRSMPRVTSRCHRARGSSLRMCGLVLTHISRPPVMLVGTSHVWMWYLFFRVAPTTIPRLIHHRFPWDGSMDVDAWGHGSF